MTIVHFFSITDFFPQILIYFPLFVCLLLSIPEFTPGIWWSLKLSFEKLKDFLKFQGFRKLDQWGFQLLFPSEFNGKALTPFNSFLGFLCLQLIPLFNVCKLSFLIPFNLGLYIKGCQQ